MSALAIKIIACVTMLIDHTAETLNIVGILPYGVLYEIMRSIGRIAFPLFCFQLALGVNYSKNRWKYLLRLLLFAVISEIPFDFALFGGFSWAHQSVYVTLLLGFVCVAVMKWASGLSGKKAVGGFIAWGLVTVFSAALAETVLHTDYGAAGVLAIAVMGFLVLPEETLTKTFGSYKAAEMVFFGAGVAILTISSQNELFAMFGLAAVWAYNGERGYQGKVVQWLGYAFYPVHLAALALIFVMPKVFGW